MRKRTVCGIIIAILLLCCMGGAAWAKEPNAIEDKYDVNGAHGETITYYNALSSGFSNSPGTFLKGLLSNKSTLFKDSTYPNGRSMVDLWLQAGVRIFEKTDVQEKENIPDGSVDRFNPGQWQYLYEMAGGKTPSGSAPVPEPGKKELSYFKSLKEAEQWAVPDVFESPNDSGVKIFQKTEKTGDTFATVLYAGDDSPFHRQAVAAYFTDFQIVALYPDAGKSDNYVPTFSQTSGSGDGKITASNVMNLSSGTVTASQNISQSHTTTATSTLSGSSQYTFSEGIKLGEEVSLLDIAKVSTEISFTMSQAFTKGWSKSEAVSDTSTTNHSVSVTLPPYTNVMLKQVNTKSRQETRYNCPVGIKYKVYLVYYFSRDVLTQKLTFGGDSNDARADLLQRAVWNRSLENYDPDGIDWLNISDSAIELATRHVPMSSAGGELVATLNTVTNEVDSILPVYPLKMITLKAPAVSFISDKPVSYGSLSYLTAQMKVGDYSFTNYLDVQGYNIMGVEYYGFSKFSGHWIVTDQLSGGSGEMDPSSAPVKLEKDPVSGNMRYTAVRPGTCYLKYVIDENIYNTAENPTGYTKNSDLLRTAVLQIVVSEKLEYNAKVEPTCDKDGHIAYYRSKTTGRIYEDADGTKELTEEALILPSTGHEWSQWQSIDNTRIDISASDDTTIQNILNKLDIGSISEDQRIEYRTCVNDPDHIETRVVQLSPDQVCRTGQFIMLRAKKITRNSFTLKWNRIKGAVRYEIYGGECGDACVKLCSLHSANNIKKINKINGKALKPNRYYRFYVTAYCNGSNGAVEIGRSVPVHLLTKGSSRFGNIKKVVLKTPKTISLGVGQTAVVRAVQKKDAKRRVKIHSKVRYVSSNPLVASVGQTNGRVTAIRPGGCKIYCIGQNGRYKTVTLNVGS